MILGLSTSIVRAEENESYDYTYRGVEISGNRVVVNGSSASTDYLRSETLMGVYHMHIV